MTECDWVIYGFDSDRVSVIFNALYSGGYEVNVYKNRVRMMTRDCLCEEPTIKLAYRYYRDLKVLING